MSRRRVELVLLHPSDEQPVGTAAWLAPRPQLARHHHIRLANPQASRKCSQVTPGLDGSCTSGALMIGSGSVCRVSCHVAAMTMPP